MAYWVDTSSNSLAGRLVRKGGAEGQGDNGGSDGKKVFRTRIDEQIVFGDLDQDD